MRTIIRMGAQRICHIGDVDDSTKLSGYDTVLSGDILSLVYAMLGDGCTRETLYLYMTAFTGGDPSYIEGVPLSVAIPAGQYDRYVLIEDGDVIRLRLLHNARRAVTVASASVAQIPVAAWNDWFVDGLGGGSEAMALQYIGAQMGKPVRDER